MFKVVCDGLLLGATTDACVPRRTTHTGNTPGGEPGPPARRDAPPGGPGPGDLQRRRSSRRGNPLGGSLSSRTLVPPSQLGEPQQIFAMKCLRPHIRSDVEQFTIGSEDLVHETAILANLSHEHIIKLHGRASGTLTDAFVLNDGYFILLDRLNETLDDRICEWKDATPRGASQLQVAHDIADAMVYLHSRKIM